MMENFKLKVFREVADNLKYRRAADELHSTQPAVSAQIRSLEDSLGIAPFDRVGRETTLAAAPERTVAFFSYCRWRGDRSVTGDSSSWTMGYRDQAQSLRATRKRFLYRLRRSSP